MSHSPLPSARTDARKAMVFLQALALFFPFIEIEFLSTF